MMHGTQTVVTFERMSHRYNVSIIMKDGEFVRIERNHQPIGLKHYQRTRIEQAVYAALAYHALTGSHEGFPLQELL